MCSVLAFLQINAMNVTADHSLAFLLINVMNVTSRPLSQRNFISKNVSDKVGRKVAFFKLVINLKVKLCVIKILDETETICSNLVHTICFLELLDLKFRLFNKWACG